MSRISAIIKFCTAKCEAHGLFLHEVWPHAGYPKGTKTRVVVMRRSPSLQRCRADTVFSIRQDGALGSYMRPSFPELSGMINGHKNHSTLVELSQLAEAHPEWIRPIDSPTQTSKQQECAA